MHVTPRTDFFIPPDPPGDGPQRKDITWERVTDIRDHDFTVEIVHDDWTENRTRKWGHPWTGLTKFFSKAASGSGAAAPCVADDLPPTLRPVARVTPAMPMALGAYGLTGKQTSLGEWSEADVESTAYPSDDSDYDSDSGTTAMAEEPANENTVPPWEDWDSDVSHLEGWAQSHTGVRAKAMAVIHVNRWGRCCAATLRQHQAPRAAPSAQWHSSLAGQRPCGKTRRTARD